MKKAVKLFSAIAQELLKEEVTMKFEASNLFCFNSSLTISYVLNRRQFIIAKKVEDAINEAMEKLPNFRISQDVKFNLTDGKRYYGYTLEEKDA